MTQASRVAFITGAGSGIGRAATLGLCDKGWSVAMFGRRAEKLEETAALVGKGRTLTISGDVGDPSAVRAAFTKANETFGRLDLLFNNAGSSTPAVDIDELDDEVWMRFVDTNVTGAFFCAREAFRLMRRQDPQGGRIINNGSVSAHAPRPRSAPYTMAKHAMTGLTRSLSLDGRPYDIACGQIDIGNARTDLAHIIESGVPQADGTVRPEPMMDLDEVVQALLFMADLPLSSNVQFMTVMATKMPFIGRG